ncbi:hypothetical protein NDU88_001785 [Pleurodeles waltl]|uniref:Uncharacterized protein n=1 Tax=Pleurodeles waltl TaxID=8319 RepID=A0AAV7TL97_PLEWA|nr:hypothetical protein NDU88_001785 [Pleurodeles waltl]
MSGAKSAILKLRSRVGSWDHRVERKSRKTNPDDGTQRKCVPELGRARVTEHEQRWAKARRAGPWWMTPGET